MNAPVTLSREQGIATLTLNRPEALNALDQAMIETLVACSAELAADASTRCVIVQGAGRHFMAGGDIRLFAAELAIPPAEREQRIHAMARRVHVAIEILARLPQPVIASARGAVAGFGLSLLCACDLALAADSAYFASGYRHIGLTPDGGMTWHLPRHVGSKAAMDIVLLGGRFDAAEALRLGLVNHVVPDAELEAATLAMAQAIVTGPASALRRAKRLLRQSHERTLAEQLAAEAAMLAASSTEPDFAEGITAFLEKRKPRF
jgi:2-(1,2-epoxy-1,2-dihydrophenyl)acetyl-CoA isomerase